MALRFFWRGDDARPETGGARLDADPLRACLQLERFGVLAVNGAEWVEQPGFEAARAEAIEVLDERFALVPEGYVSIVQAVLDVPGAPELDVETPPFLMAKHAVTNAQFQKFVDQGGYEQLELWPEDIWPHLIGFKDRSGAAGPRLWSMGRHDRHLASHPVVGVSYYEAGAYARWAGYRLPTEAEWQMAASWRIRSSAHVFHRYPWGESVDTGRCNIWATGLDATAPVDAFEEGAAPNGVLQLIGNVWEWTSDDFEAVDQHQNPVVGDTLMKSIRGGAYDTYFACQATSDFRTGSAALQRAPNVGFRCCIDLESTEG